MKKYEVNLIVSIEIVAKNEGHANQLGEMFAEKIEFKANVMRQIQTASAWVSEITCVDEEDEDLDEPYDEKKCAGFYDDDETKTE